jgi:hypothetical protein
MDPAPSVPPPGPERRVIIINPEPVIPVRITKPATPPAPPPPFGVRLLQAVDKWIFWRLSTALIWYWLIAVIVNQLADKVVLPCSNYLLLGPAVTSVYLILRGRGILVLWLPFYFLLLPVILLGSVTVKGTLPAFGENGQWRIHFESTGRRPGGSPPPGGNGPGWSQTDVGAGR